MKPGTPLSHFYDVMRKRAWIVALVVALTAAGAVYYAAIQPPQYRSEASVLIRPQMIAPSVLGGSGASTIQSAYRETLLNDILQLLRSRALFERVGQHVGDVSGKELARRETAQNIPATDFLIVSAVDSHPEQAALIANATTDELVKFYAQINQGETSGIRSFIDEQVGRAQNRLNAAEQALVEFQTRTGTALLPGDVSPTVQRLVDLQAGYDAALLDASVARARVAAIRSHLVSQNDPQLASISIATNPVVIQIRDHLTGLELELANMRGMYTDQHPKVQALLGAIAADQVRLHGEGAKVLSDASLGVSPAREQFVREMISGEVDAAAAQARSAGIISTLDRLRAGLNNVTGNELTLARLQREVRVAEQLFMRVSSLQQDALIRDSEAGSGIVVVDQAVAPDGPVPAPLPEFATFGGLLGVIVGAALALAVEAVEDRIRRAPRAEKAYGIPARAALSIVLVMMLGLSTGLYTGRLGVVHAKVLHFSRTLTQAFQRNQGINVLPTGVFPTKFAYLGEVLMQVLK